ncbi:MAG: sigma-70 family RNA polymerase sigma factor [Anaerolineales bacterium]|nr:sigma-70 family RNA polymerase sigma factor [Anaerolineales bacterium]MCB8939907.1 sigma-70 family RNA polymerase sigma factor [Ardenticatenaceae bacterium]
MSASEPSRPWQTQKHQEIISQSNPTAFAQLAELALPHLITFLRQEFRQIEPHLHETAAIDSLLTYHQAPQKYDPEKLSLFAYLRMAARHDLLNAVDKNNRRKRPLVNIEEPAINAQLIANANPDNDEFSLAEWLGNDADLAEQTLLRDFESTLTSTDRQFFLLMLNGVRDTEPYAEILQISHTPIADQRREVKRAKDRLTKSLSRFANRHQK